MSSMWVDVFRAVSTFALVPLALVFLASVLTRKRRVTQDLDPPAEKIAFLVPLREEVYESIKTTLNAIEELNYPKNLIDVYLIVKKSDAETLAATNKVLSENWRFNLVVYESPAERELKAVDLNAAIRDVREILEEHQVVAVFDADLWYVDPDQALIATSMLRSGCSSVSPRVYAFSEALLGHLTLAESVSWYDGVFKGLEALGAVPPLTGKSLYVSSWVLRELGGFPEELAEDAFLTIRLGERNLRSCYADSYSFTLPPKSVKFFMIQRMRWSRAIVIATSNIISAQLSARKKLSVLAPYLLSLDLVVFMLSSIPYGVVADGLLSIALLIVVSTMIFLRLESFSRKYPQCRTSLSKRIVSSLLFVPFILIQVLIQLIMLFNKNDSWRKTRRR